VSTKLATVHEYSGKNIIEEKKRYSNHVTAIKTYVWALVDAGRRVFNVKDCTITSARGVDPFGVKFRTCAASFITLVIS